MPIACLHGTPLRAILVRTRFHASRALSLGREAISLCLIAQDGRERSGYAEYEEDPDAVAQAYRTLLERLGPGKARQLGLKLNVNRVPTVEELKPVVAAQRGIARVRLTDN